MNKKFLVSLILFLSLSGSVFSQWNLRTYGLPSWSIGIAIDACDQNTAVISIRTNDPAKNIFITTDAGLTWKSLVWPYSSLNNEAVDIEIIDKNHIWTALDDGRIIATLDGGNNWFE